MRRRSPSRLALVVLAAGLGGARAADLAAVWSCTGPGPAGDCGPACSATWHEEKTTKPAYTMKCEYAGARARDSWHAPPPECRRCPPGGAVYVKKRLYKSDGETRIEKMPKYEATTASTGACDCPACSGGGTGRCMPGYADADPNVRTLR